MAINDCHQTQPLFTDFGLLDVNLSVSAVVNQQLLKHDNSQMTDIAAIDFPLKSLSLQSRFFYLDIKYNQSDSAHKHDVFSQLHTHTGV